MTVLKVLISRRALLVAWCLTLLMVFAQGLPAVARSYESAQAAVDAVVAATRAGNTDGILAVLGPEGGKITSSGDPIVDQKARERFTAAYDERHELRQEGDGRAVLIIGKEEFPVPIPLVREDGAWRFDTAAGAEEIVDRRIGENELSAIEVLRAYVDAQREYAEVDHDGRSVQYARRLLSSDGRKDGLYWPSAEGKPESPLGALVGNARAEGYASRADGPTPYHGYLFRILTAQGDHAPGGARDYIVKDRMIGGFGLVAVPAEYGNSGVMTFVVNQDGVVFERDLGPESARIAAEMNAFDPDDSWRRIGSD